MTEQIAQRIGRTLERCGLIERDTENAWLANFTEAGPLDDLIGHSITYRIAVGPRAGQKLFTLQTVHARLQGLEGNANGAVTSGGFSVARRHHAHRAGAAGSDGKTCSAGASAADAPDEVSWGVRPAQRAARPLAMWR